MFKSWLELTFRHVSGTFRCVSTQQRVLFCLRVFTKWNKPLMGLICQEALHTRPLAVRLYTHSLLEMNFGSHKGDDNNCKASALPISLIPHSFFTSSLGCCFFSISVFSLSLILISIMQRRRKCILFSTSRVLGSLLLLCIMCLQRERELLYMYEQDREM